MNTNIWVWLSIGLGVCVVLMFLALLALQHENANLVDKCNAHMKGQLEGCALQYGDLEGFDPDYEFNRSLLPYIDEQG